MQNNPSYPNSPYQSIIELIPIQDPHKKGGIAYIYEKPSNLISTDTMDHLRSAWKDDLGGEITEEQWQTALEQIHCSSICARHGLLQFKIIHCVHWSKQKPHKIFPSVDPSCHRSGLTPASLGHMFWSCPKLSNYWHSIFQTLLNILHRPVGADPLVAVLEISDLGVLKNNTKHKMISFVSLHEDWYHFIGNQKHKKHPQLFQIFWKMLWNIWNSRK